MIRELRSAAEVRAACGGDDLVVWAAQGLRAGARAWALGDAVAAACPQVSRRDRLAVLGGAAQATELVRHALAELGPSYRPLGEVALMREVSGRLPGLEVAGEFSWMSLDTDVFDARARGGAVHAPADGAGAGDLARTANVPESTGTPDGPGMFGPPHAAGVAATIGTAGTAGRPGTRMAGPGGAAYSAGTAGTGGRTVRSDMNGLKDAAGAAGMAGGIGAPRRGGGRPG
ncbi:hypothetical protein FE391_46610, partial [Nonomuraea sp. KC401]